MASRPMPRAKRRPAPVGVSSSSVSGASSDPKTLVDKDAFFIAAHPPRPPPVEEEDAVASSSTPQPASQDPSPRKKKRKQLPEWVGQSVSSDDRLGSPAQEADAAAPTPPRPPRERSVSVTPPPELDEEMLEFARQAVEKVMRRNADGTVRHADKDLDLAPTSDDVSLDLNADLARYYKGPNAQQLRERAIAREREMQAQRQRRNEEAEVTEILDQDEADEADEAPPTTQVITIDDSSDDERAVRDDPPEAPPPAEETHDTENTMSLLLRAAKGEPLPVKVRPTTKFSTILGHFVQTYASLLTPNEQQKAYLSFEGEVRFDSHAAPRAYGVSGRQRAGRRRPARGDVVMSTIYAVL